MVSVIIPAYNEEMAIAETVTQVRQAVAAAETEIIVVDDCSSDETAKRAREAGATVVRHPVNHGYGAALMTGIRAAAHDTIVITDADGTYPNGQMPDLLAEFGKGFDMVVGARTGSHYRESFMKMPLRLLLKWLVEWTTGREIPDINSGLRVFSKQTILTYLGHLCRTFSFTTSLTLAYMMTGKSVAYVPIEYHERVGSSKVRLIRDSLRTLQYIVQAILYYNPLKLFLLMSGFIGLLAVANIVVGAVVRSVGVVVLGVNCLLVAVLVFCIGLLADLLRLIMTKR